MHGMDVDRMYSLANLLHQVSQELMHARSQLDLAVAESSSWVGPAGEEFRQMLARSAPALTELASDLDAATRLIRQQANEQRSVSW